MTAQPVYSSTPLHCTQLTIIDTISRIVSMTKSGSMFRLYKLFASYNNNKVPLKMSESEMGCTLAGKVEKP